MVYNLHITTDEAGALLELSDSLADQLEGVVEAFNRTIHPAGAVSYTQLPAHETPSSGCRRICTGRYTFSYRT